MGRPIIRPATSDDIEAFARTSYGMTCRSFPVRIRGFVGELDGEIIALGGISFWPDGTRMAFCDLTEKARKFPIQMHRAAKMTMALADELGIKRIVATTLTNHPAGPRWLLRLGFMAQTVGEGTIYVRES